jgi:hypothetical protein
MLDPQGTELLQSMPSMFSSKNKHGIYGAGDCDCIVIAALACLEVKNFKKKGIVLAGRSRTTPVHIYNYVNGVPMDLTNEHFNKERKYAFRQWLPVNL